MFILYSLVFLPVLYLFLRGTPVERGFFCDDPTLSYPYKPDTVSTPLLIILGSSISVIVVSFKIKYIPFVLTTNQNANFIYLRYVMNRRHYSVMATIVYLIYYIIIV